MFEILLISQPYIVLSVQLDMLEMLKRRSLVMPPNMYYEFVSWFLGLYMVGP